MCPGKQYEKWSKNGLKQTIFNIFFTGTSTTMYAKGFCAISSNINHFYAVGAVLWRSCDYHTAFFLLELKANVVILLASKGSKLNFWKDFKGGLKKIKINKLKE